MAAIRHGGSPPSVTGFLPVLITNLLPLIGVLRFGWNPETLVAVYALELLLLFPLAGLKALFAGRPPTADRESGVISVTSNDLVDKRGSVPVHNHLPPIYPRNVPFAAAVVSGSAWIGLFIGLTLSNVLAVGDVLRRPEVLGSVFALVVGHLIETYDTYIRSGRYAEVSPYAVVETPARQGFFLAFAFVAIPTAGAAATTLALAGFVFVKVLFEWSGFRAERGGGGRLTDWLSGPASDATPVSPTVPDGIPEATIAVNRRSVVATAIWRAVTKTGPFYASMATVVWLGMVALFAGENQTPTLWAGAAVVALSLFAVLFGGDIFSDVLAERWMTYRRIDDRLVAYDRLTETPQWSTPLSALREAAVVETRLPDRCFGTRTLTVKTGWDDDAERILGPVTNPEDLIETFDLPVQSTELPPLDQRFASLAAISVGSIGAAIVALLVTPFGSPTDGLYVLFLLPFVAIVPKGLWKLAHG